MMASANRGREDTIYSRLFAWAYDPVMRRVEERFLLKRRRELFDGLRGRVLEVGAGTGINFPLYPADASVLAIEPSAALSDRARRRLEQAPPRASIELLQAGLGDPVVGQHLPDGGFDAVVLTLVLCTLPDPEAALATLRQWLRPGGRLYVLEHIVAASQPARIFQHAINPVWRCLAEGCHLTRRTDLLLRSSGFIPEWERYHPRGVTFYQAVLIYQPSGRMPV